MRALFPTTCLVAALAAACSGDALSAEANDGTHGGTGEEATGETGGETGSATSEELDTGDERGSDGSTAGICAQDADDLVRPAGWGAATHCKGAAADYDLLFDDTAVHRFDITIDAAVFASMQADLDEVVNTPGWDLEPLYVPATVEHNGTIWWEVGVRYKGNSSLHSAAREGIGKLALRMKFDEFEDENEDLLDQRFYGFKKMTFSNGYKDDSLIRDKLGGDIFRAAGLAVARSSFARIYVDVGEGPRYWGLYTMIEDPSNKMLDRQFEDGSGNLYKPDGDGARLAAFQADSMIKKTNEEDDDFSDVEALIEILNAGSGEQWRASLEAVFDVDGFLTLLAVNQSMVDWDSYGWMTHNYYLYGDPSDNRLTWIPWDLNESLITQGGGGGGPGGGGPGGGSDSVLLQDVGAQWPMIRRLLDDEVYNVTYRERLLELQTGAFDHDATVALANRYHDLISPYVVGDDGEVSGYTFLSSGAAFETSISGGPSAIADHITARHAAVNDAL